METIKKIFSYKLTGLNFLLVLLFIFLAVHSALAVPVLFILVSNLFDILGYHFTLIRRSTTLPEKEIIKAYRINQMMFDFMLMIVLGLLFGWVTSLCGVVMKITGVQDIAYYVFLRKPLPETWHWLRWTPFGWFRKILTKTEVIFQAAAGVLIAYTILFIYLRFLSQ